MRVYLGKIKDAKLVGKSTVSWLANRNPQLGVRVFADDHSKVNLNPCVPSKIPLGKRLQAR